MKRSVGLLADLLLLSATVFSRSSGRQSLLPNALVKQIISDQYPSGLPSRVSQPVRKWEHLSLDLSGGGKVDYIVEFTDPDRCGSGGCGMLIYVAQGKGYSSVYTEGNFYTATRRLKTKTNGYFDVLQRYQANDGRVYFHTLRFDGKQYRGEPDDHRLMPKAGTSGARTGGRAL